MTDQKQCVRNPNTQSTLRLGSWVLRLNSLRVEWTLFEKGLRLRRFKWDWDKVWQDCSARKCASIDVVGFLINFQDGGHSVARRVILQSAQ